MLQWEVVWQLLGAVTLLLSELIGSKGEAWVQQLSDGEKCYLRASKVCLVTVGGSVSCISEDGYQLRAVFVLLAVEVARFAVEEVSRGRRTWSQIYFATGSCVKSLQRTCKA